MIARGAGWQHVPDDEHIELQQHAALTRSERRVLELLAQGLAPKQAAWELRVTISTVRSHIAAAKRKTGTRTLQQLVGTLRGGARARRRDGSEGDEMRSLLRSSGMTTPAGGGALTARQMEITLMLGQGLRQVEIATRLGISQRQVSRLAAQARDRATATTSSHLVALLAQGRLQPPATATAATMRATA